LKARNEICLVPVAIVPGRDITTRKHQKGKNRRTVSAWEMGEERRKGKTPGTVTTEIKAIEIRRGNWRDWIFEAWGVQFKVLTEVGGYRAGEGCNKELTGEKCKDTRPAV